MTAFMDKFDDTRNSMIADMEKTRHTIVALLEHIGKGIEDQTSMPSQEALGEMKDASSFKKKNLDTAQR
jgi:hypothetical protein